MTNRFQCRTIGSEPHYLFRNIENGKSPVESSSNDGILYAAEIGGVRGETAKKLGALKRSALASSAEMEAQDPMIKDLEATTELHKGLKNLLTAIGVLDTATLDTAAGKAWEKNNDYVGVKFTFAGKQYRMMLDNDTTGWDITVTDEAGQKVYDKSDTGTLDVADDAEAISEALAAGVTSLLKPTTELHKNALALVKGLGGEKIVVAEGSTWKGNNDHLTLRFIREGKGYALMLDNDITSWDIELTDIEGNKVYSATDMGGLDVKSDIEAMKAAIAGKPAEVAKQEEKNEVSAAYRLGHIDPGSTLTGMEFKPELDYHMTIHRYLGRDDAGLDYALVHMPSQKTNGILRFRGSAITETKRLGGYAPSSTNDVTVAFLAIEAGDWGTTKDGSTEAVRDFIQARNGHFWQVSTLTTSTFTSKEFQNTRVYKTALVPMMEQAKNK